ncbi:hypothetical protein AC578_2999 [Pseudocercospora eumusae]|uniref:NAD(P)-binding domain-containing protein n=1 Tax=Pseudocercospora eumusae TaxID=321146 RepID=A0A139GTU7_9PEZI|nr:hypothetical protein AC578_2999 [Pseudocercospora eumusae]
MTKLFVTGATGYIGGDALYAIVTAHPDYEITALVRNTDKGGKVAAQFASVRLVYGDLDSTALIEEESRAADIVCHFAHADHEASAKAIIKGLSSRDKPGFLIHTSGTGILTFEDLREQTFGTTLRTKIYNDLENVSEVTSLPDDAPHRNVDKIILQAAKDFPEKVKTAIVCPPTIYGPGRGPDNQTSIQLPGLCRMSLKSRMAVKIETGKTMWNHIHIHDLSSLYLNLVQEAAAGGSTKEWPNKPATWGEQGYYFCENGEHVWGDVSLWIAEEGVSSLRNIYAHE